MTPLSKEEREVAMVAVSEAVAHTPKNKLDDFAKDTALVLGRYEATVAALEAENVRLVKAMKDAAMEPGVAFSILVDALQPYITEAPKPEEKR